MASMAHEQGLLLSQDDIIDDVEDFVAAADILKERGAYRIYIMATHGLLSADAPRLIEESAIDEVNTPRQRSKVKADGPPLGKSQDISRLWSRSCRWW